MENSNKTFIVPIAIIIAGALIGGAFIYIDQKNSGTLSIQEAGEKAIDFINGAIEEDVTASLVDIADEGKVYKIYLKIGETEYESYITKDGKFLFPSGYNLEEQQTEEEPEETAEEEITISADFAKCLTEKEMKFYGSKYCGWCQKEKELFGDNLQYVTYIECIDEETDQWSEECQAAGIDAVPTWQLPDGEMSSGFKTFEQLAEISGCPL